MKIPFEELKDNPNWGDAYWELGYLIIGGVFKEEELEPIRTRFDRWYAEGMRHPSTFRHQNKIIWVEQTEGAGKVVRGMQWPSYEDHILDAVRTDPRMFQILQPLIGNNLKQIINQLHWKTPRAGITWGLHRDVRSRKPDEAFRELATSYVQTGLAVDRHWAGNGAMKILPGSHRIHPDRHHDHGGSRSDTGESSYEKAGYDMNKLIDVEMDAGDVALWTPFTIHGGGMNTTTDSFRRLYINGYVIGENCDRGEWVFRDGKPVPLDLSHQALIQFAQIRERPEAHYPGRDAPGAKPGD